jgi:hypothetical protein
MTVFKPLDPPLAKQKMAPLNNPTANFYQEGFLSKGLKTVIEVHWLKTIKKEPFEYACRNFMSA